MVANGRIVQGGTTGQYPNSVPGLYHHQQKQQQRVPPSGVWMLTLAGNSTRTDQHHYTFLDDGSFTGEAFNIEDKWWLALRGKWDRKGNFEYSCYGGRQTGKFTDASMTKVKGDRNVHGLATITFSRALTAADRQAAKETENIFLAVSNRRKDCVIS